MSYMVDIKSAVKSHAASWNPTLIVFDNKPAQTKQEPEFIRIIVLTGQTNIATRAGINVTGTRQRVPLILRFNVYTQVNNDTDRSDQLCDEVIRHWQKKTFGGLQTLLASAERIGEAAPRYRAQVDVQGFYDHRIVV